MGKEIEKCEKEKKIDKQPKKAKERIIEIRKNRYPKRSINYKLSQEH